MDYYKIVVIGYQNIIFLAAQHCDKIGEIFQNMKRSSLEPHSNC